MLESCAMELLQASFVVTGQGFSPQVVTATTLEKFLPGPPDQAITTPPLTAISFQNGYQVIVQENKIDVKRAGPPEGADATMQAVVQLLLSFWPMVKPTAIGINFVMGGAYDSELTQDKMLERLTPKRRIEAAFGQKLIGSRHSFVFRFDPAKVTANVTTDALIAERAGFTVDFNVHHETPGDVQQVVESQAAWYDRVRSWAEELTLKSW